MCPSTSESGDEATPREKNRRAPAKTHLKADGSRAVRAKRGGALRSGEYDGTEAEQKLAQANRQLEGQVRKRTAELRKINRALAGEIARGRQLEGEILDVSEQERRCFGEDLHDDICQRLSSIELMMGTLATRLSKRIPTEADEATRLGQLISETLSVTRALASGLHPVELDANGLVAALQELAGNVNRQVSCHFGCDEPVRLADSGIALNLYRIAQEAVTNALKHARARKIFIELRQKRGQITLRIRDDGAGLRKRKSKGMGLHIMPHRARTIGAKLTIRSKRGHGTQVICTLKSGA